tara:strand:- start:923 stop:2305 length:1383 start_codon:yes stop_codon:yes gene_type:complete
LARPYGGKWIKDKHFLDVAEDCYIYKRPKTNTWQYYLCIAGEGEERATTKVKGKPDDPTFGKEEALKVALARKLEVLARHQQGLKARRVKGMFDFIDEFLAEEKKRVKPYNQKGFITAETFRIKSHHLNLLKKFYHNRSIRLEDLDYPKLHTYPIWRSTIDENWNPQPPKTRHTILTELTTIKAYFAYLLLKGYISREPTFQKIQRESLRVNRRDYLNPKQYKQTINTLRKWKDSQNLTPTNSYNRQILYECIIIMSNALLRKGELKGLKWSDLEENPNLSKLDKKIGHLIRIRGEISKTGEPRVIQSPTTLRFNLIRELQGIPKVKGSSFPHVPTEYCNNYIIGKYNHFDEPLGVGTWDRQWKEIKKLCAGRYWNHKNITWYSFRHTGISFAVSRSVPMLQLSRNAGTGTRYIEEVYYHHESESKQTWDILTKNRVFYNKLKKSMDNILVPIEDVLEDV